MNRSTCRKNFSQQTFGRWIHRTPPLRAHPNHKSSIVLREAVQGEELLHSRQLEDVRHESFAGVTIEHDLVERSHAHLRFVVADADVVLVCHRAAQHEHGDGHLMVGTVYGCRACRRLIASLEIVHQRIRRRSTWTTSLLECWSALSLPALPVDEHVRTKGMRAYITKLAITYTDWEDSKFTLKPNRSRQSQLLYLRKKRIMVISDNMTILFCT